jgi:hypothetical protein
MSTAQVNGTPTTSSSTNNNSNTIRTVGNGYNVGVSASTVVEGVNTAKAVGAGVFAHVNTKPITFSITNEIAGVPSSSLSSNGYNHENIRNPAFRWTYYERLDSTAMRAGDFNFVSGKWTTPPLSTSIYIHPRYFPISHRSVVWTNWINLWGDSHPRHNPPPMTLKMGGPPQVIFF